MKTTINPLAIYRVPRFPLNADLRESWEELKEAIKQSSNDFYGIIKDTTADQLDQLPEGIRYTIYKYFNRAKFRATPYGTFAAIGITKMDWNKNATLILEDKLQVHSYPDWGQALSTRATADRSDQKEVLYYTNSTYYIVQDEIRYIQFEGGEFQISAVDNNSAILLILKHCQNPLNLSALASLTKNDISADELPEYLEALIEVQLLLTSSQPNIIGEDYFSRIGSTVTNSSKQYLIAERKAISGIIDAACFRHLPKALSLLQKLAPLRKVSDLTQFIEQYIRRFEQLEIPLMEVLDPEIGIGYGKMEKHGGTLPLLEHLFGSQSTADDPAAAKLRNTLYPEIIKALTLGEPIKLENILIGENGNDLPIPNSISAIITMSEDEIYLESLGGSTAIALAGRFGLAIPEIYSFCKDIARQEQEANPEVLFFDVGYVKEGRVDNINRRPAIYPLSLCILNYDTSDAPLSLTDMLVSIRGNEIYLRSRKYNKRMIPRLTTAYNFNRSDLSLFRFLMDLQQQGLQTQLLFRPHNLIPGLNHYPRIQFANIIISRACWRISADLFEHTKSDEARLHKLTAYLNTHIPCRYIRAGSGDQTLCLDVLNAQDIRLLLEILTKAGTLIIEESALPLYSKIRDKKDNGYLPELILTLQHEQSIYTPLPDMSYIEPDLDKKLWIPPGGEWLYFEIYSSVVHTDALLSRIKIYLAQFSHLVSQWFFIRYNEDGDHLRLRIQLIRQEKAYDMIRELSRMFQPEISSGIITDLKLRTYKKETQRYSIAQIDELEAHFFRDSKYVLSLIGTNLSDLQKYRLCIQVMEALSESDLMEQAHFQKLVRVTLDGFTREQNAGPAAYKELNKIYRDYLADEAKLLDSETFSLYNAFKKSFLAVIENSIYKARPKRAVDLMHMHVNRLFTGDQRTHELIIYHIANSMVKRKLKIYFQK